MENTPARNVPRPGVPHLITPPLQRARFQTGVDEGLTVAQVSVVANTVANTAAGMK